MERLAGTTFITGNDAGPKLAGKSQGELRDLGLVVENGPEQEDTTAVEVPAT